MNDKHAQPFSEAMTVFQHSEPECNSNSALSNNGSTPMFKYTNKELSLSVGNASVDDELEDGVTSIIKDIEVGHELGSYRLLELLGEGGMGKVFLAEHKQLGRKVALKVLLPELTENSNSVRRFFAEAKAVNQINHENIVEVTDFSTSKTYKFYIMEYLAGCNLEQIFQKDPVIPLPRCLNISTQIAAAMAAVHDSGFVHRDLKPANIFVTQRGSQKDVVKILDFGVAKLLDVEDQPVQTKAGLLFGSPGYIAPEYATGMGADLRSDIYALGVILFEMVTGERLFASSTAKGMLIRHITDEPRVPSKVNSNNAPPELDALILQCLEKQPEKRPLNMMEIVSRLHGIAKSQNIDIEHVRLPHTKTKPHLILAFALLLVLTMVVGGALGISWYINGDKSDQGVEDTEFVFDSVPVNFEISIPPPDKLKYTTKPTNRMKRRSRVKIGTRIQKIKQQSFDDLPNEPDLPSPHERFDLDDESLFDPFAGKE